MGSIIKIFDMTLRDGLQSMPKIFSLSQKKRMFNIVNSLDIPYMEIASTTKASLLPQMEGSFQLYKESKNLTNKTLGMLCTSTKYLNDVLNTTPHSIGLLSSISNTFANKNMKSTFKKSLYECKDNINFVLLGNKNIHLRVYLSCAFGCKDEGFVVEHIDNILQAVEELYELFIKNGLTPSDIDIVLADTYGFCYPERIQQVLSRIDKKILPYIALHLHSTPTSFKNVVDVSLSYDIMKYDTALLGIGGCPYGDKNMGNLSFRRFIEHVRSVNERLVQLYPDSYVLFTSENEFNKILKE